MDNCPQTPDTGIAPGRPPLVTPVVLLVFNRTETTRRVLAEIRKARPTRLFVVADGPRPSRPGEAAKCAEVRALIDETIDWPCEVSRDYSEDNLGCRRRVSSGLDWVFSQVEDAIILEDDCLPHPDFFPFCAELLDRYRQEPRVALISGSVHAPSTPDDTDSYYFSRHSYIWGWATWRRTWIQHDKDMETWPSFKKEIRSALQCTFIRKLNWITIFNSVYNGKIDSWAYPLLFSMLSKNWISVVPMRSMIRNIGFGDDSTHTTKEDELRLVLEDHINQNESIFPLKHPLGVTPNYIKDSHVERIHYTPGNIIVKIMKAVSKRLRA